MMCPVPCGAELSGFRVGPITICPQCLRSCVIENDTARLATADDTIGLSAAALATLRKQRGIARKALDAH